MTQSSPKQRSPRRSRRHTAGSGFPLLAAQLPEDFRSATAVSGFIYSLTVEVTAGRVEPGTDAVLGYLTRLAIQTLPFLRIESEPMRPRGPVHVITHVPRPDYPKQFASDPAPNESI